MSLIPNAQNAGAGWSFLKMRSNVSAGAFGERTLHFFRKDRD
jgi:hypothetical protein